jgi:hypothetical protein
LGKVLTTGDWTTSTLKVSVAKSKDVETLQLYWPEEDSDTGEISSESVWADNSEPSFDQVTDLEEDNLEETHNAQIVDLLAVKYATPQKFAF